MKTKYRYKSVRKMDSRTIGQLLAWGFALTCLAVLAVYLILPMEKESGDPFPVFSEVMSDNTEAYPAPDGEYYGWFEIWNRSDKVMDLSRWKVCAGYDLRGARNLPEVTLPADGRIMIWCTQNPIPGAYSVDLDLADGGIQLLIMDGRNKIRQTVNVPSLKQGEVYVLREEEWERTRDYTPGLENTREAYERLLESGKVSSDVRINELMADNRSAVVLPDKSAPDWVELINNAGSSVNLAGWSLTNDISQRKKWVFPESYSIPAGACQLLYCGTSEGPAFRLDRTGGALFLLNPKGQIADILKYEETGKDVSVSRTVNGSVSYALAPSPGQENSPLGSRRSAAEGDMTVTANVYGLYINEVASSMKDYNDWLEISNGSGKSMDLSGWYLSDDENNPRKWAFPTGTVIANGAYMVVFLNGSQSAQSYQKGYLCADFALSEGECAVLAAPDGTIIDRVPLRHMKGNVSLGRVDGMTRYRYFEEMTPGAANSNSSKARYLTEVSFSRTGGIVREESIQITLTAQEGTAIYYTTDGSRPNRNSSVYTGPIRIAETTVLKAIACANDAIDSPVSGCTYLFNTDTSLRLVCVSGDAASLTGENGVLNTGKKDLQEVYAEVYDYDGSCMVMQECELCLSGSSSRLEFDQKAFRLTARSEYGESRFNAALFTNRDYTSCKSFVLRASGQDCKKTHMVDSVLSSLAEDLGLFYQESELAAVYINGQYWGMYNMRERANERSVAQFEGWAPDRVQMIKGYEMFERTTRSAFLEMMELVHTADFSKEEDLLKLRAYCDIENYLDYVALMIYVEQEDLENTGIYRNADNGQWRWMVYDMDLSYQNDKNSARMWLEENKDWKIGSITQQSNELFVKLMKNEQIRDYFLTRMGYLLRTTFSAENVLGKIQTRYEAIKDEMERNCERWGFSVGTWMKSGSRLIEYASSRTEKLKGYLAVAFGLSEAEAQKYFG